MLEFVLEVEFVGFVERVDDIAESVGLGECKYCLDLKLEVVKDGLFYLEVEEDVDIHYLACFDSLMQNIFILELSRLIEYFQLS